MSDEIRVLSTYSTKSQTLYNLMAASMHLDGDNAEPLPYGSRLVLVRGELADRIRALEAEIIRKDEALNQAQVDARVAQSRVAELEDALGTNRICANCTGGIHHGCAGILRCNCGCSFSRSYKVGERRQ